MLFLEYFGLSRSSLFSKGSGRRIQTPKTALALLLFCIAGGALAQTQAAPKDPNSVLEMVRSGDFDGARAALEAQGGTDLDRLFLEAQIRAAQGRREDAASILRAILAAQPGNVPVRQALADVLFADEDYDAAAFHFRELKKVDPRKPVHQIYDRALREIEARKPFGFSASLALTPSTNINRGTRNESVEVDDNFTVNAGALAVEESGFGLQVSLGAFARAPQELGLLTYRIGVSASLYSNSDFNTYIPSASVEYSRRNGRARFSLTGSLSRTLREEPEGTIAADELTDATVRSFRLSYSDPLDRRHDHFGSISVQQIEYDDAPASTGTGAFTEFGIVRGLDATTQALATFRFGRYAADQPYASYYTPGLRLGLSKTWKGGWNTYLGLQYERQQYDQVLPFSGQQRARFDNEFTVQANILNSRISYAGFAPRVTCLWQRTASSVDIYDSTTKECSMLLTRGF